MSIRPRMKASHKDSVNALMKFEGTETRTVKTSSGEEAQKNYLCYLCPNVTHSKVIAFQAKSGFRNLADHLKMCYGKEKSTEEQDSTIQ